ncbi:tRNA dihydrouridine synthase [Ophidiomyces ophidiicola]|uniref:tRNA dihydrouridine synthase n=1 Tax=Ophidiomyces ophidiicola TaxID=1387563 RepID=UPI0020C354F6|nr:tRNA dihydrouridine synthase [Ophidiomyces ophidiicola]KAI1939219.1 tRNA dihydrouridine synthase [Ophidiomyces ophidiicola]KAI2058099.1 tRNA dihydrouridine synthase [Ophidiomyces ophidiicola]KAI2086799.1 tRNA dihydrouridine synthase [Ophidiomyces ophidiicola]
MSTAAQISNASRKMTGREFYQSLGSPKMILAPMVDRSEFVCDCAWRMLTRSFVGEKSSGHLLAYSPMLHARLFKERPAYRSQHFEAVRAHPSEENNGADSRWFLDGNPRIDRPLIVQFCANEPDELLEAAKLVQPYCDAVDLNLGCPQGIAKKGRYGAFLQEEPDLIYKLINTLHTELSIPVTAKFRILETKEKTLEYAKMILSAGASFISVHGRRREQKGHNTGVADWSYIRYLRDNLPPDTVIFANGNILNHDDIQKCLETTGADGVMSAEGNLSDPTIFSHPPPIGEKIPGYWRGRNNKGGYRLDFILRRYMDIIYKYVLETAPPKRKPLFETSSAASDHSTSELEEKILPPEQEDGPPRKKQKKSKDQKTVSPNLCPMQGHLFQLLRPLVSKKTHVRDALARCRAGDIPAFENVLLLVEEAVKEGIQEYNATPELHDESEEPQDATLNGSKATIAKYKRPWWVCQPYIRPLPEEAMEKGALQLKKKGRAEINKEAKDNNLELEAEIVTPKDQLVSG